MKCLIAEDDFVSRKLLNTFLLPYGEVDIAANGKEALEAFAAALSDHTPYDLICLDVKMPGIDGLQALQKIREIEKKSGIKEQLTAKVIMTTGFSDKEVVIAAARFGCSAYMIKPLTRMKVITQLEDLSLIEKA